MEELEYTSCHCPNPESRIWLLEEIYKVCGENKVHDRSYYERFNNGDYEEFPYVTYDGESFSASSVDDGEIEFIDFVNKLGLSIKRKPQGDSKLVFKFI